MARENRGSGSIIITFMICSVVGQGGEVHQVDGLTDEAGFVLGVGADPGLMGPGGRRSRGCSPQLTGQVGDGTGIAAGQQLAADDALLGHLLHQRRCSR